MALNVTPGDPAADSYASVAATDAYFAARGVTTWTGVEAVKEGALRRATTGLDNLYRGRWMGTRFAEMQALAWPRVDGSRGVAGEAAAFLYDSDGFEIASDAIPSQIVTACMEFAALVIAGVSLEPRLERGGAIKSIGKSVGPLRKDITYTDGASPQDRFLVVEGLLRGLVTSTPGSSSGNVKLVRA